MLYREPKHCIHCNEPLKARYGDMGKSFVGDTFLGYEPCKCQTLSSPSEEGEKDLWEDAYEDLRTLDDPLVEFTPREARTAINKLKSKYKIQKL